MSTASQSTQTPSGACVAEWARSVLLAYEPYRSMSPHEIGMRIDVPLDLGKAALIDGKIFVSWMRPRRVTNLRNPAWSLARLIAGQSPEYEDWLEDGPMLWLVDVASTLDRGQGVGQRVNEYLLDRKVMKDGDTVCFRRSKNGRVGWAVARRRH